MVPITSSALHGLGISIRAAARQPSPDAQLAAFHKLFTQIYPGKFGVAPRVSGIGRTEQEYVSESYFIGKSGKYAGMFRIFVLNDTHNRIHKLTVKVSGRRYVLAFPSTAPTEKLQHFLKGTHGAMVETYERH